MMGHPLALFVDPQWRNEGQAHIPLLYSAWGNVFSTSQPLMRAIFDQYPFDASCYSISDKFETADAILFPYRYTHSSSDDVRFTKAIEQSESTKKPLIIDATGDIDYAITIPRAIVLKWGGYRTSKRDNEIIVPPYADDLLEHYCNGALSPSLKTHIPTVGFAGRSRLPFVQNMRGSLKHLPISIKGIFDPSARIQARGVVVRQRALDALRKSRQVHLNAITRATYSANVKTAEGDQASLMRDFIDNALSSDFCLDVRGDANASTRLFELLSLGRVPLIIDTDRNFPFSDDLDYRAFSITVPYSEISHIADIARDAYDRLSESEWLTMQEKAREAYREWFRPDAMTKHLMRAIRSKIAAA